MKRLSNMRTVMIALTLGVAAVGGCSSSGSDTPANSRAPSSAPAVPATSESTTAALEPHGDPVPATLRGKWFARFTSHDLQTSGLWHLVLGPGHHAFIWEPGDAIDNRPDFEGGPVYFDGHKMTFGLNTAEGICPDPATYSWSLSDGQLRFKLDGEDSCQPRQITFPVHAWHR
jgi:hypothetical protein